MIETWASPETTCLAQQGEQRKATVAYYDPERKCYWVENADGDWMQINEQSLRRLLKAEGLRVKAKDGDFVSEVEARLIKTQLEHNLSYAAPLAGYRPGLYKIAGRRVLVTCSAKLIEPKPGEWPILNAFLTNLFGDQLPYVLGWLKVAYEALREGRRRPGQALVIAGEHNCGKSVFQNLTTEILGGRAAKPHRYMSGGTDFNGDLFGAEHLMIEDEVASTHITARRNFGARIKDFTVNEVQSCHGKNKDAISLTPFWRLSISVNREPENLMILPPLDDSISDKLILLKGQKRPMPMPTGTGEEREKFWATLMSELPAFLDHLIKWQIPADLRSQRFGIREFHHPELLDAIEMMAPETRLLSLVDTVLFGGPATHQEWTGTADELRTLLSGTVPDEVRRLLDWPNATGVYLGRLAAKHPDRVKEHRSSSRREWLIQPP